MIISSLILLIGFYFLLNRYNLIAVIIGLEIMLLGANINFMLGVNFFSTPMVTTINLILVIIAAVETVIGLAIIVNFYQQVDANKIPVTGLKG